MADNRKENINALFTNTRSRVIIIFTIILLLSMILIGYFKFHTKVSENDSGASLSAGPQGIQSIPGSVHQTAQYAALQEKQNIEQAEQAEKGGHSSIPTIVRSQMFGSGIEAVGPRGGKGSLGFSSLSQEDLTGPQQSLWLEQLEKDKCDKKSVQTVLAQGAGLSTLKKACSCEKLRENGYHLVELRTVCNCPELKSAGYSAAEMRNSGFTASELKECGYNACQMQAARFSAPELKSAGYTDGELKGAGFDDATIHQSSLPDNITDDDIRAAGCRVAAAMKLREQGVSAAAIRRISGCSASELKAAGYNAKHLVAAGYSAGELKKAGFKPAEIANAGLTGTSPPSNLPKNCSPAALAAARAAGISAQSIRDHLGCNAKELKNAGYTAEQLKDAGFTAAELKTAGFTAAQLKNAGFTAGELKAAGYTAAQLKAAGFTAAQLKAAGFTAAQLKAAGFSAAELKAAGFTAAQLSAAGFSPQQLLDAGFSRADLRAAGITPPESKEEALDRQLRDQLPGVTRASPVNTETQALNQILHRQQTQAVGQQNQQAVVDRTNALLAAANQVIQGMKFSGNQEYIAGNAAEKSVIATATTTTTEQTTTTESTTSQTTVETGPLLKAGDVIFAVLDTEANTDQPGPILATIVSGPFKGGKLIGSFTLPANADSMVITFNTMTLPGIDKTMSITAYAIDPNTAETALSSSTNHHYLLRYGSLFASSFLEGFGNAFQSANTTVTIGGVGGIQTTTIQSGIGRSVLENAVIGLATVGKNWGQVAQQLYNTPTTVKVYSGTGVGVLFTQNVMTA